jgi:hypothetical protein
MGSLKMNRRSHHPTCHSDRSPERQRRQAEEPAVPGFRPRLQTSLTPHPPYNVVIQNEADRRAKRSGCAVKDPSNSCSATAASRCSPINLARCHSDRARSAATASGGTCFFAACSQQPRRRNPHRLNPCHPERSERRAKRTGRAVKDPCNSSSATAA